MPIWCSRYCTCIYRMMMRVRVSHGTYFIRSNLHLGGPFIYADKQTHRETDNQTNYQNLFGVVKTSRSARPGPRLAATRVLSCQSYFHLLWSWVIWGFAITNSNNFVRYIVISPSRGITDVRSNGNNVNYRDTFGVTTLTLTPTRITYHEYRKPLL